MIVGRAVDMNLTSTNFHRVPGVGCLVTEEMKEIGTSVGFGNVLPENLSGHFFHRSTFSAVITFLLEGKVLRF